MTLYNVCSMSFIFSKIHCVKVVKCKPVVIFVMLILICHTMFMLFNLNGDRTKVRMDKGSNESEHRTFVRTKVRGDRKKSNVYKIA